ncbi:Iq-domain [Thalictrum thalictroides]|uniref:Iq-domain n=1 Tax=Thalictrum thalictroides TaxID=46969 RepID=A0A7J6W4C9_THATH|nr:Iq-domain [Thalictrum thalictroides]
MGLTGGLVKSVFSKNRSIGSQDSNVRNYGVDKRRWSTVRSYLCGDEYNSVLADADSASIRSSEATVTQPAVEEFISYEGFQSDDQPKDEQKIEEKHNSSTTLSEENAAVVIQFAFRRFLARCKDEEIKEKSEKETVQRVGSPSLESVGTSVEVQTGGSFEVLSLQEERIAAQHRAQQKARSHAAKLKEDWDDSTVSSNIAKSRIQSRLEATTRRERALAYAFSQQLRVCSKKKLTQSDTPEANMGWNWLERWMAARPLETCSVHEDRMSKQNEPICRETKFVFGKKNVDTAAEEESCGSNEVSIAFNRLTITAPDVKHKHKPAKNRFKAARTVSRRKTVPSYQIASQWMKETKIDCSKDAEKDRKYKQAKQSWSTGELKQTVASPDSSVLASSNQQ